MPLPDIQRKLVEEKVGKFCESRVPPQLRNTVRVSHKIRANSVIIFEYRASCDRENEWIEIPVAKMRYDENDYAWTLYYADRNSRWHEYIDLEPKKTLDLLLQEIKEDLTGIFWG